MTEQPYTAADKMPKDETLRLLLSSEEGRRIDDHMRYHAYACRAAIVMFLAGLAILAAIVLTRSPVEGFDITELREYSALPIVLFFGAVTLVAVSPFMYVQNKVSLTRTRKRREEFLAFLKRYKRT